MNRPLLVVPLLAFLFPGCRSTPTTPESPIVAETVLSVPFSGLAVSRQQVIHDRTTWSRVWSEIHAGVSPMPPLVEVDFGRDTVLLAAQGERPDGCWSVDIPSVTFNGQRLLAQVVESHSQGCACIQAVTRPVHVARVGMAGVPASFAVEKRVVACSSG